MNSRLWTSPPMKPDGTLDYAQYTMAEVCADLAERLSDLVFNAGENGLESMLGELPDSEELTTIDSPSRKLVSCMETLLELEETDDLLQSDAARDAIRTAIDEILPYTEG